MRPGAEGDGRGADSPPIIDSHVHCSEPHSDARPYDPDFVKLFPGVRHTAKVGVGTVLAAADGAKIPHVVLVTYTWMGDDNRYPLECAARHPDRIIGVVGRINPVAPAIAERLRQFFADPAMLCARFTLVTPATRSWLADRVLDPFLEASVPFGRPVQIYAPDQAQLTHELVRRFPETDFVVDHMTMQAHRRPLESQFADWPRVIALANEPNVWMKVSFFPEAARHSEAFPFPRAQLHFRNLVEEAGTERLIWGSNSPPVLSACSYGQALEFVRTECAFLQPRQRAAILGGNLLRLFPSLSQRATSAPLG
jgi:predicted TIM-barrel fold metal-dependent hydrolase